MLTLRNKLHMNHKEKINKVKCDGDKCEKMHITYYYDYNKDIIVPSCINCIPDNYRHNTNYTRMEHHILNDIYKKIRSDYKDIIFVHDSVYGDPVKKQRPDLIITYLDTMIFIEIDEGPHFNKGNYEKDLIRIQNLGDFAKNDKWKVRVIRIIPDEYKGIKNIKKDRDSMFEPLSNGSIIKINSVNYHTVMDHIIRRIKVIFRQAEEAKELKRQRISPIKLSPESPESESHRPKTIDNAILSEEKREKQRITKLTNKIKLKIDTEKTLTKLKELSIKKSLAKNKSPIKKSPIKRSPIKKSPIKRTSPIVSPKRTSPKKSVLLKEYSSTATPDSLSISDLKAICKELGLVTMGSRIQLIEKIKNKIKLEK